MRECIWCQETRQKYVYVVRKPVYLAWLEGKGVVKDKHNRIMKGNRLGIKGVVCYGCLKRCNMSSDVVLLDDIPTKATKQAGGMIIRASNWHFQRSMITGSSNKNIWTVGNTLHNEYYNDNRTITKHQDKVKKRNNDE